MAAFSSSFPIDSSLLIHLPNNANFSQLINYQPAAQTLEINHKYYNNEDSIMSTVTSKNSNTSMDTSSIVTTDQQQEKDHMEKKKRKCKEGSFANSAQSKDKLKEKKKRKMKDIGEVKEVKACKEEKREAPTGYIHVRARRGQATDRHSLSERVRRERISERMKLLQALVPGCDKVTGKALILDEIINHVQSLQNQVEFLSMKLASTNPTFLDFGMDLEPFMDQNLSNLTSPILPSMHAQVPDGLPLENGQVPYDMDDQSEIFIGQYTGFSNNLYSCN